MPLGLFPELELNVIPASPPIWHKNIKRTTSKSHSGITSKSIASETRCTKLLEELGMVLGIILKMDKDVISFRCYSCPPPTKKWD